MNNTKSTLKKVIKLIYKLDNKIFIYLFLKAIVSAMIPFIPIIVMGRVIDKLNNNEPYVSIIKFALIAVGIIFILYVIQSFLNKSYEVRRQTCTRKYDTQIAEHTINLDYACLESDKIQELRSRIIEDSNWGYGINGMFFLVQDFIQRFLSLIIAIVVITPILRHSFILTISCIFFFIAIIILLFILLKIKKSAHNKQMQGMQAVSLTNRLIMHFTYDVSYKSGKDIRLYNGIDIINRKGANTYFKVKKEISKNIANVTGHSDGFAGLIVGLGEGFSFLLIAIEALKKVVTIGQVVTFAGAINQFTSCLSYLVVNVNELIIHTNRFVSTLEYLDLPSTSYKELNKNVDFSQYTIEFKNVSFRYPQSERFSLKNINLTINNGQHVAIVGENGSGKSTLIKLLCRLYQPTEGEILLNGIDINTIELDLYFNLLAVVFQDFTLFAFPIIDNITLGEEFHEENVLNSLEQAGFSDSLSKMNSGINTPIYNELYDDGIEVSGGEAQKIAIARAIYKNAPIVLLDEPTSALDPFAEAEIYTKFSEITKEKTAIFISHRLSSCKFCDLIAVFDKGNILEIGTHDELLKNLDGKYAELWNAQAQYYC